MESHPLPQQISSYQFRLVGDMTLKQFFQLAGGILISIIFYASKLHPLIKWPFILFFALLGAALAFLPFEDRPLETWILSFFRNIYSPTIFGWSKIKAQPAFFQDESLSPQPQVPSSKEEEKIKNYLATPGGIKLPFMTKLEDTEKNFLNTLSQLFGAGATPSGSVLLNQTQAPLQSAAPTPGPVMIPTIPIIKSAPRLIVEEKASLPISGIQMENVVPMQVKQDQVNQMAQFSAEAAPPNPPTVPNTIVGQILDNGGKIVEGAILEVRDASGRPVRALRSNKLGHFMVVTPLQDGKYEIYTDKEGYSFEPIYFDAPGGIIPPIAIQGKKQVAVVVAEVKAVN